jgi:hypothetical protein
MRAALAIVLIAHGLGHLMAIIPLMARTHEKWHAGSWLLDHLVGRAASVVVGSLVAVAITLGFVLSGLAVGRWGVPEDWWRGLAAVSGVASLIWLIAFWHSLATLFNKVGAIAVNLMAVVGVLIAGWPGDDLLG